MRSAAIAAGLAVLVLACGQPSPAGETLAFIGATVLPVSSAEIVAGTVIVKDGRIIAVGPTATTPVPEDAERIDHPCHVGEHARAFRKELFEEHRPRQAQPLLAADRAPDGDHLLVEGVREPLQPLPLAHVARLRMRPHVQLSVTGMAEEHRGRRVLLEHPL